MSKEHILESQIKEYCASGIYPMHMPGHKRRLAPSPGEPYEWDVTEVEGMDDLHHAEGILRDAMDRTAGLFGSVRTWYLVNGSTCGILAAMYAAIPLGGEVILARNCHKAVFHAAEVFDLHVHFLLPSYIPEWGICGSVDPEAVQQSLLEHPGARAMVLTSPTYEGVVSDIASIATICRKAGVFLIVDEAHGAHLGLFPESIFPDSAVHAGADLVIQSAHKTLPSLTQTAFLHLCREDDELEAGIEAALDIFETSSPSYPLLSSLDGCTGILANRGRELFLEWSRHLERIHYLSASYKALRLFEGGPKKNREVFDLDPSKLLFRAAGGLSFSGKQLQDILRGYEIEAEMSCGKNVLLMSACSDDAQGWKKLEEALQKTDVFLDGLVVKAGSETKKQDRLGMDFAIPEQVLSPSKAHEKVLDKKVKESDPAGALGMICAEYVMAYPPGIPILIPGERILEREMDVLRSLAEENATLCFSLSTRKKDSVIRIHVIDEE